MVRGEPHPPVGPGGLRVPLVEEIQEERGDPPGKGQLQRGIPLHLLGLRDFQQVGDIDFPPLQHRRSRGGVGDALEDQPLHRGHLAPVALVRLHDQLDARRVTHELVGAEADGVLLEALIAHPLDILLRHDPARAAHQRSVEGHEVGPRIVQVEAHPVGIDDRHLPDLVVEDLRSLGPVEAEPHVLGGERVAIVEFQSLAELEFIDALVRTHRPRLGEAGGHQVAGHGLDQRVVDGIEHPERGETADLSGSNHMGDSVTYRAQRISPSGFDWAATSSRAPLPSTRHSRAGGHAHDRATLRLEFMLSPFVRSSCPSRHSAWPVSSPCLPPDARRTTTYRGAFSGNWDQESGRAWFRELQRSERVQ